MGIHDRDYYRDSARGMFDTWGRAGVTIWLIVITSVVFLAQVVSRDVGGGRNIIDSPVGRLLIYHPFLVMQGEVWRLLTPIFLHAGILHLAFNMLVLYWAGSRLEEHYGSREFLLFYLLAGLVTGLVEFFFEATGVVPPAFGLGASGPVMATLILFACHYPRQIILVMFVIPMPVWLLAVCYVALDALGAFGIGDPGIGYITHLGGAAFALLYYRSGWRIAGWLPSLSLGLRSRGRTVPRLRVVPQDQGSTEDEAPEAVGAAVETPRPARAGDEHFEARVDEVLEKVSKHGQESLTSEEREILFRASEHYKKRRK
jgi:membrane associated rhomboid family serine protease